jgi:hypothetical protein
MEHPEQCGAGRLRADAAGRTELFDDLGGIIGQLIRAQRVHRSTGLYVGTAQHIPPSHLTLAPRPSWPAFVHFESALAEFLGLTLHERVRAGINSIIACQLKQIGFHGFFTSGDDYNFG